MFCASCFAMVEDTTMTKCPDCCMYFCVECAEEHLTLPCDGPPGRFLGHKQKPLPRIVRKKKYKKHQLTKALCDYCHREFYTKNLNYGTEPFAHEIYNEKIWCKLCDQCLHESLMDI